MKVLDGYINQSDEFIDMIGDELKKSAEYVKAEKAFYKKLVEVAELFEKGSAEYLKVQELEDPHVWELTETQKIVFSIGYKLGLIDGAELIQNKQ